MQAPCPRRVSKQLHRRPTAAEDTTGHGWVTSERDRPLTQLCTLIRDIPCSYFLPSRTSVSKFPGAHSTLPLPVLQPTKPNAQLRADLKPAAHATRPPNGILKTHGPGDPEAMQRSQVICLACRRQRAVAAAAAAYRAPAPRSPQWQSRASSSTTPAEPLPVQQDLDSFIPSIDTPVADEEERPRFTQRPAPRFKQLPRRPNFRKFIADSEGTPESLRIFQRVVKQQADKEKPTEEPRDLAPGALQFYNDLSRLRPMMKEESIEECFDFFLTKLWNNQPFQGRNRLLKQRGTYLVGRVAEAKMSDMDNEKLPSVAQITQILHEMESLSTTKWTDLIMGLIRSIISKSAARADYPSSEAYEEAMARKAKLLEDLVESWIVFHRHRLSAYAGDFQSSEEAEFRLPHLNVAALRTLKYGDILTALGQIFPQNLLNVAGGHQRIPAAALATFVLLVDPNHSTLDARRKAKPLLQSIARIVTIVKVRPVALGKMLEPFPDVLAYVLRLWDTITARLRTGSGTGPQQGFRTDANIISAALGQTGGIDTAGIQAQLTDALKMGDAAMVEAAWAQYWGTGLEDPERMQQLKKHNELVFNYFILAFTALRRPQRAVDVWDSMASIKVEPTLKTWTSMIEGCRRAKNPVGLENVWKKLVASGTQLDAVAWSARIAGLIDVGQPEAGLQALSEMQKLSKQGGAQMNVETINAAVSALIRLNAMSAARKVLSWASENGVEPDVVTYNILLRPMVHQGNVEGVATLLTLMGEQKVEPDGATWTILLDGLIYNTKDASPAEQRQSVQKLFDDIEAAGAKANMETCARMIHLLLRDGKYSGHHTQGAVGAIYDHIQRQGLRPSTYIYTMLVDHYFRCDPPAVAEVEELLTHRGLQLEGNRGDRLDHMDRIFWERLINGFASAGHVDRAFELFRSAGVVVAWMTLNTLETLLRSLVRGGRMAEAQVVVNTVKQRRSAAEAGAEDVYGGVVPGRGSERTHRRHWNHAFWSFAHDSGLLPLQEWKELEAGSAQLGALRSGSSVVS